MSTAATFIPTFVAAILVLGGANEFSIQLMLVGVLSIITHTALSPVDPSGLYPNFDNYHPVQPPFRDYVLVFGLASLMFVALFSRIYPLASNLCLFVSKRLTDSPCSSGLWRVPLGGT